MASYIYNALNQRVQTMVGTTATEFVFNAAGQRVSIWNGSTGAQLQGQYYWGGKRVAFYSGGVAHFQHQNWLGTERMRTTYSGSVEGTFTSLPFGDGQATVPSGSDLDTYHYAMLDHDTESDTDHAQFRQYSNAQGRLLSPDPYGGSYDFSNPQSMNRFAYVLNNPLTNIDPSGLYCIWDEGPNDDDPTDGGANYEDCIAQGGSWMDTTSVTVNGGAPNDPGITIENGEQINPVVVPVQKKPCDGWTRAAGIVKAADGAVTTSVMGNLAVLGYFGTGFIVVSSCAPEPGVFVTCPAGLFAAGSIAGSSTVMAYGGYKVATEEMIPGIEQAITCTETE